MAIREVLLSNTFEQQRQLINLIGTDIGDCQNLVTPSKVVTTSINQVVAGFVTLSGQTIQLEDGLLGAPSLSFDSQTNLGLYKQATDTLGITKNLFVGGNLTVDGDITFRAGNGVGGSISLGDLNTDNIVFNADINSNFIPNTNNTYDLGSTGQRWRNLYVKSTAFIDTLQVNLDATIDGDLSVNGGDIITTASGVTVFNTTATTASIFGSATIVNIGASTGTLTLRNPTVVGVNTTQNLYNTVATTVNAFGSAYDITMGVAAPSGVPNTNFTVRSDDTILNGDLNVNGGEILSSQNTFLFLVNNSDIRIGSTLGTGSTVINNSLKVKGTTLDLTDQTFTVSLKDNLNPALRFREGTNDYLSFQTTDTLEKIIFHKITSFTNTINLDTGNLKVATDGIIKIGNSDELQLYYNGATGQTIKSTGDLRILTNRLLLNNSANDEQLIEANQNGSVALYYDNAKKLETTSAGITVTGNITASGLTLSGDLTVNGTTTTINSTVLSIDDVNIVLADGASTSAAVDGAGITLGTTGITFTYSNTGTRWSSTENLNIATGKTYQIAGTTVLSATQVLGKGFTNAAGEIVTTDGTQTLSAKTLTTPAINGASFGNGSDTTDANTTIDAATTELYYKQASFTADRTILVSNLTAGRRVVIWVRNTNATIRNITFQASTTTTGHANVTIASQSGTSNSTIAFPATTGVYCVTVYNAGGNIVGHL